MRHHRIQWSPPRRHRLSGRGAAGAKAASVAHSSREGSNWSRNSMFSMTVGGAGSPSTPRLSPGRTAPTHYELPPEPVAASCQRTQSSTARSMQLIAGHRLIPSGTAVHSEAGAWIATSRPPGARVQQRRDNQRSKHDCDQSADLQRSAGERSCLPARYAQEETSSIGALRHLDDRHR